MSEETNVLTLYRCEMPRVKEGCRACENERVLAEKREPRERRNSEEVTPSACICVCVKEIGRGGRGRRERKRKTDMVGMMEDGRSEHELILGI